MKNIGKILVALLAIAVLLSFPMVIVSADEGTETNADTAETTVDTADDTTADTSKNETSNKTESDDKKEDKEEDKSLLTSGLITLGIIAVIVVCVVFWILKDKERASKTWRSFKSEFKKVVWADKHETLKNTIIVIVIVLLFGLAIGLVDYLLSVGIVGLGKLV